MRNPLWTRSSRRHFGPESYFLNSISIKWCCSYKPAGLPDVFRQLRVSFIRFQNQQKLNFCRKNCAQNKAFRARNVFGTFERTKICITAKYIVLFFYRLLEITLKKHARSEWKRSYGPWREGCEDHFPSWRGRGHATLAWAWNKIVVWKIAWP